MRRFIALAFFAGCGSGTSEVDTVKDLRWASGLHSFTPGEGAGYGKDELPDVVLGAPKGGGTLTGSLDVVSLGKNGEIVLSFEDNEIVDREGPDLIVFENVFYVNGDPKKPFRELGEVSVSVDGTTWATFACDVDAPMVGGCAGMIATSFTSGDGPLDPSVTGGDAFDLSILSMERARFVRVRDLSGEGESPIAGFDLDAIGRLGGP